MAGVTASTGAASGALTVAGGAGIGGDIYGGGIVRAASTTDSTSTTTGAIRTQGGLGVEKSAFFGPTVSINAPSTSTNALNIGGNSQQIVFSAGTGTHRITATANATMAFRVNSLDAISFTSSILTIGIPLGATPGGLQPLCFNSADGRVYKAVLGVC